jgi:2-octaprenyl-6-methoxyphenol hydroxylase
MIGISAHRADYDQFAVIGNLLPEMPPKNRAFERFTEDGPVVMLPVADDRAAFVWIMSPAAASVMQDLSDEDFTARLQEVFGFRLGMFSKIGKRAAYPLSLTQANGLVSRRSVVVGNAAHGLHPVAAQGFNLGMRDVATLCDCIYDAQSRSPLQEDVDPGSPAILENYAQWRRPDQKRVVHFTDSIVRLFASSQPPVRMLRNVGMLGFDLVPGIRSLFAKYTMGLAGRLPRLSRGVPLT